MSAPQIIIISGPNGAGKSTSSTALVTAGVPYINADEIAKGLHTEGNSSQDMEASRLLLAQWEEYAGKGQSFAIETTLASRSLAAKIRKLQEIGYQFQLYYFWLPNPEMAVARVTERVKSGGHHIPEDVIRRRYEAGWRNFFEIYRPIANYWEVYVNLQTGPSPLVAQGSQQITQTIAEAEFWNIINRDTVMPNKVKEPVAEYEPLWKIHERAVGKCVRAAILEHKRINNPIYVWRDENIVWLQPDEIEFSDEEIAELDAMRAAGAFSTTKPELTAM